MSEKGISNKDLVRKINQEKIEDLEKKMGIVLEIIQPKDVDLHMNLREKILVLEEEMKIFKGAVINYNHDYDRIRDVRKGLNELIKVLKVRNILTDITEKHFLEMINGKKEYIYDKDHVHVPSYNQGYDEGKKEEAVYYDMDGKSVKVGVDDSEEGHTKEEWEDLCHICNPNDTMESINALRDHDKKLISKFIKRLDWVMERIEFHTENPDSELMDEISEEYKKWEKKKNE